MSSDSAAGCLVGLAYGDALGVPYEYGSGPLDEAPRMLGGGLVRVVVLGDRRGATSESD